MNRGTTDTLTLAESFGGSSSLFMASPRHALLTQGLRAALEIEGGYGQWEGLPQRVRSAFRDVGVGDEGSPAIVVGAMPFDEALPTRLVFPEHVRWVTTANEAPVPTAAPPVTTSREACHASDDAAYSDHVRKAIERIRSTALEKVVLARSVDLTMPSRIDVPMLLRNLVLCNPDAYTFAVNIPAQEGAGFHRRTSGPRGGKVLLGASPELLVSRSKLDVVANPLAGSAPRSVEPVEDGRRANTLLNSRKERREHAFVVEAVAEALRPFCAELRIPREPSLLGTGAMWHLSTEIRGRLRDPSTCSLRLATALHPTPAVCGTPRAEAMGAIRDIEGFDRGFYAGFVGWSDANGDGEWVVTIRCGEVEGRNLRAFAGAGIVDGSSPEDEFIETSAKLGTILSTLRHETEGTMRRGRRGTVSLRD